MIWVLLSTYNGERFLATQLDSLISQDFSDWQCIVRDDGSSDRTLSVLEDYLKKYPDKFVLLDDTDHIGWRGSFSCLLDYTNSLSSVEDYVMFCDQDDLWFPHKMSTMYNIARSCTKPCLLFSDLALMDDKGGKIEKSFFEYNIVDPIKLSWNSIFAHNVIPGMSILVSVKGLDRLLPVPSAVAYDWWIIAGFYFFFEVKYINQLLGVYRLHSNNAVGSRNPLEACFYYIKNYSKARMLVKESMVLIEEFYKRFLVDIQDKRANDIRDFLLAKGMLRKYKAIKYNFFPVHLLRRLGYLFLI